MAISASGGAKIQALPGWGVSDPSTLLYYISLSCERTSSGDGGQERQLKSGAQIE